VRYIDVCTFISTGDRDTFMCNGRCIGLSLQCNGIDDCGDNTDEQNCGMYS